jgi:DNA polymerase I
MFESSSKSRYSGRIAVCNSTKYCRVDFKMRSGNRHILRAFGKLETVRMFDDTRKAHSLGCVLNHSQKVYASSSYGSSGDSLSNNRPLSSRVIPTQMGDRQAYNSKPGNSKLRPSIRDHRDIIGTIQEKNAEVLKKKSSVLRSRAKMKYEQKTRREGLSQGTGNSNSLPYLGDISNHSSETGVDPSSTIIENKEFSTSPMKSENHALKTNPTRDTRDRNSTRKYTSPVSQQRETSFIGYDSMPDDESGGSKFDDVLDANAVKKFYHNEPPKDVHVVESAEEATRVMKILMSTCMEERTFACDTEVMNIDVTRESPCCHGTVTCFSLYCGPDVHFGSDPHNERDTPKSMVWVDTWLNGEREEEARSIIEIFKPFFESETHHKVWHNYSFDRHVLERMGISCKGFYGDTMHMARLWDSSRTGRGGYSLEALTTEENLMGPLDISDARGKISMKKIFGKKNIKKDGTEGKLIILPPIEELQASEETRWDWINYSAYDAKATWDLHEALVLKLMDIHAIPDKDVYRAYQDSDITINNLWDIYSHIWRPFGNLLTDLEASGVAVDVNHLMEAEKQAKEEEAKSKAIFREWAASKVPDARYMNVGSSSQVVQLLFAGAKNRNKDKPGVPLSRTFKVPNVLPPEEGKKPKKNMDITIHNVWSPDYPTKLIPEIFTPAGLPGCSTQVLKTMAGKPGRARKALAKLKKDRKLGEEGIEAVRMDFDDTWSTDENEISKLQEGMNLAKKEEPQEVLEEIAKEQGFGRLFSLFGNREEGLKACAAVDSLIDASAIDTLLSNFIVPLQSDTILKPDQSGIQRVHCSLNINTETGRLSARRPNLQNQPALEKDRYKVRQAFTANKKSGNTLIVADYGQLELRILAHMANCTSMIEAFELGGDFHSRTALGMYDHIKRAIDQGDCLLEWDAGEQNIDPPVPLLKDMFSAERRRAKVLNFSIAYGKTAHGLSKDWGVTLKEAEETVERWYAERAEVRTWQHEQHALALSEGYVCTILGRRRQLPDARSKNRALRSHSLRAAINTPIQGSAADVATAAMLRIDGNKKLREMGWKLLLQVHDEVILEGPKESATEAQQIVIECMKSPFGDNCGSLPLRVELSVDSKYADTWYDAK